MVGLAATLLGAQATVGLLVAKALTSQNSPYLANTPQGFSPVLALDVFLIQVRRVMHLVVSKASFSQSDKTLPLSMYLSSCY